MEFSGFHVDQEFLPTLRQQPSYWTRVTTVFDFPLADDLQGAFPVADFERFAYFLAGQKSIHPDRTLAMTVFAALGPMFAAVAMPSVDGQHLALLEMRGFGGETVVHPEQDSVWNAKRQIASFVSRAAIT
jgi:hypothetical protein